MPEAQDLREKGAGQLETQSQESTNLLARPGFAPKPIFKSNVLLERGGKLLSIRYAIRTSHFVRWDTSLSLRIPQYAAVLL
jgi:hypothetical protein